VEGARKRFESKKTVFVCIIGVTISIRVYIFLATTASPSPRLTSSVIVDDTVNVSCLYHVQPRSRPLNISGFLGSDQ
jgi:hypothetical protein